MGGTGGKLTHQGPYKPEGLWLEADDGLVALHAEVEGRGLAWAVAHDSGVKIAVLACTRRVRVVGGWGW